jgi:hypothetical protein
MTVLLLVFLGLFALIHGLIAWASWCAKIDIAAVGFGLTSTAFALAFLALLNI